MASPGRDTMGAIFSKNTTFLAQTPRKGPRDGKAAAVLGPRMQRETLATPPARARAQ